MDNKDPSFIAYCECCGEPIYEDYDYYHLPDGAYLCGKDYDCLMEYVDAHYLNCGGVS